MSKQTRIGKAKMDQLSPIKINQVTERVLNFVEGEQLDQAEKLLNRFLQWPFKRELLPLLRVRAKLYHRNNNFIDEAATYNDILQFLPNDSAALRGRSFAALRMGAPQLAATFAKQTPDIFSESELLELQQASVGRSIKWGAVEAKDGIGKQRFHAIDKAIKRSFEASSAHDRANANNSQSSHYTEFDRIVALRDRVRMDEVIALYQTLKQRNIIIPAYALAAVADAYLYQRQPEQARDMYLEALALSKNDREYPNREWQLKLFNAYIDANEFDTARELIDKLVDGMPPVLNRHLRGVEIDNEFYEQARVDQIHARISADQFNDGEQLLNKALEAAPFNFGARLVHGDLLQSREQPRAAQREYASVLVDDPSNSSAAIGIAETAINLQDNQTAKQQLDTLIGHYPEDREVQRVKQLFDANSQPLFTVTSGWGNSPTGGGNLGNQDWKVDTLLNSPLLNHHWRVFTHTLNTEADFKAIVGVRRRVGIGADYRSQAWRISGEINQDQTRLNNYGFNLNTSWLPDDHWGLDLEFTTNSNNIPLRASASGISMRTIKLGANFIQNEARNLNATLGYSWLSDGNRRIEAGINWQERWWSGPVYKLDTVFGGFISDNSLVGAAYFNPKRDYSFEAQAINKWIVWREYQRSFKNRLVLGAGHYWQQGFKSGMTSVVRYEHEWNFDPYRSLNYGVAYERHPYDGQTNELTSIFLNLTWHL